MTNLMYVIFVVLAFVLLVAFFNTTFGKQLLVKLKGIIRKELKEPRLQLRVPGWQREAHRRKK